MDRNGLHSTSDDLQALIGCLREIEQTRERFQFILLRHQSLNLAESIDSGDVDLLGTEESSRALIELVAQQCRQGRCHFRVMGARREKLQLTLFSPDGRHHIRLDLWTRLRQFASTHLTLTFASCTPLLCSGEGPLLRLPVTIEASIYLQHLVAREKTIASASVQNRLGYYIRHLMSGGSPELARQLERVATTQFVHPSILRFTESFLEPYLLADQQQPGLRSREQREKILCGWLRPFRRPGAIALIGCDGAGKTSLSRRLTALPDSPFGSYVIGRKLYQHSLFYYLFTAFSRRILGIQRDQFEARFGIPLYLVAAWYLQMRLLTRRLLQAKRPVVIDRSLVDFLITARKTDRPRLLPGSRIRHLIGERFPVIHLWVDHAMLASRKQEMTDHGHALWDQLMFEEHTGRLPTDYLGFQNGRPLDDAVAALQRIIQHEWPSRGKTPAVRPREIEPQSRAA